MVNNRRKDRRAQRRSRDTIVTVIEEKDSCKLVSKRRALSPCNANTVNIFIYQIVDNRFLFPKILLPPFTIASYYSLIKLESWPSIYGGKRKAKQS
jgi:hypothetical protein